MARNPYRHRRGQDEGHSQDHRVSPGLRPQYEPLCNCGMRLRLNPNLVVQDLTTIGAILLECKGYGLTHVQ